MKNLLRIVIALIFIASGLVKAVDVVGFSFKLEEYFATDVFNMPFLEKLSVPVAIFIVVVELLLGTMLLLKVQLKKTLVAMVLLCIFFAFLTFYSAYFNKVTDCGCFGDAIKFTPWQSFFKDVALLFMLVLLYFLYRNDFNSGTKNYLQKVTLLVFLLVFSFVVAHGILHEPLVDFRDYKVGTDLNAEREMVAKNPPEYKLSYTMKNTQTGEEKVVTQDEYVNRQEFWQHGTPWKIESGKEISELVRKGYVSEVSKFKIEDPTGKDWTSDILSSPRAILIFTYKPQEVNKTILQNAEDKAKREKSMLVFGVSTQQNTFKDVPGTLMDGTAIKTIARSNPFVLILQKGIITAKMSAKDYLEKQDAGM